MTHTLSTLPYNIRIVAIDPGTTESGMVVWDNGVIEAEQLPNADLRLRLKANNFGQVNLVAIEMVASFGMPVGKEVFETVRWIGIFQECAVPPTLLVYRKEIKIHLCGTTKAKDPNIRAALIDKLGAPGTTKKRGPTYGVTSHLWAALAVADYARYINPV